MRETGNNNPFEAYQVKPEDAEKITNFIGKLEKIYDWLLPIISTYTNYLNATKKPLTSDIGEARIKLINNFPSVSSPFNNPSELEEEIFTNSFARFCQKYDLNVNIQNFTEQINDFIEHKGTGKIGAIRLYSELDKLIQALKKFENWLNKKKKFTLKPTATVQKNLRRK
jgi:hypothetical protein